jgi:hypothetical protein
MAENYRMNLKRFTLKIGISGSSALPGRITSSYRHDADPHLISWMDHYEVFSEMICRRSNL